jgi:lipoprotein-releasing system permease protein
MKKNVNLEIAVTHIFTRKKQTLVAALGVTIGVGIYLFMNSLSSGFTSFSRDEIFKNSAHLKIYKDDEMSAPLIPDSNGNMQIIINAQTINTSKKLVDPEALVQRIRKESYITHAQPMVSFDAFYNRGKTQLKGSGNGVNIRNYNEMFNLGKYMAAGDIDALQGNLNGIIIGNGIAEKLNLGIGDNITVSSSQGVTKVLKITGIFETGNSMTDQSKSYVNISTAQQMVKEGPSFVSTIYANTPDANHSEKYMNQLQQLTSYRVEDWKTTNADVLAGDKTRATMMTAISFSILLVASFGIYNILSATISQKINDIAILKATGFSGRDVIKIFVSEALMMGIIGTVAGLLLGAGLIAILSNVYMGGPVGYFPIRFEPKLFTTSLGLGILITLCAGFFPAKKAARVDPVAIFRK